MNCDGGMTSGTVTSLASSLSGLDRIRPNSVYLKHLDSGFSPRNPDYIKPRLDESAASSISGTKRLSDQRF